MAARKAGHVVEQHRLVADVALIDVDDAADLLLALGARDVLQLAGGAQLRDPGAQVLALFRWRLVSWRRVLTGASMPAVYRRHGSPATRDREAVAGFATLSAESDGCGLHIQHQPLGGAAAAADHDLLVGGLLFLAEHRIVVDRDAGDDLVSQAPQMPSSQE